MNLGYFGWYWHEHLGHLRLNSPNVPTFPCHKKAPILNTKRVRCTTPLSCFHCTHTHLNDSLNKCYLYRCWWGISHTNTLLQWTMIFQGFLSDLFSGFFVSSARSHSGHETFAPSPWDPFWRSYWRPDCNNFHITPILPSWASAKIHVFENAQVRAEQNEKKIQEQYKHRIGVDFARLGRTPKGGVLGTFWKTPSQNPFWEPFSEPLFYCKTHSRPPSQNPSGNPFPRTLSRTFSEPFSERCVAVRPLRRAP